MSLIIEDVGQRVKSIYLYTEIKENVTFSLQNNTERFIKSVHSNINMVDKINTILNLILTK
jgi:hypothetical protein